MAAKKQTTSSGSSNAKTKTKSKREVVKVDVQTQPPEVVSRNGTSGDYGQNVVETKPRDMSMGFAPPPPPPPIHTHANAGAAKAHAPADLTRCIRVRGAREHNLKNIDVNIPRDGLVVITGLSGSGKSSLAFDTIFAEGQRKYMESLSAYARQFLDQLKKPDVDDIEGLPPTIAIEQRSGVASPRSTVATTTEIYDYLRLLYARCGTPHCWAPTKTKKDGAVVERCGREIKATPSTQIIDAVMEQAKGLAVQREGGARLMVLAPVVRARKGFHRDVLEEAQGKGWGRARVNGKIVDIREVLKDGSENPLKLGRYEKHDIDIVVDRIGVLAEYAKQAVVKTDANGVDETRQRVAEAIEAGLREGASTVIASFEEGESENNGGRDARPTQGTPVAQWVDRVFSSKYACPEHPECALPEIEPRLFSFNSPSGACPTCHGLGAVMEFAEELVIPDAEKSLSEGAVKPWKVPPPMGRIFRKKLKNFAQDFGVSMTLPVSKLPAWAREILVNGTTAADEEEHGASFDGVATSLRKWYEKTESAWMKEWLGQFMQEKECPECRGDRLKVETLHVLIGAAHKPDEARALAAGNVIGRDDHTLPEGKRSSAVVKSRLNIAELSRLNIGDAVGYVESLQLTREQQQIAEPIVKEVMNRLGFLASVGLEYLSLDRKTGTLSGGEAQRIRLATQVGSKLVGACYVLDEPTIGLHQRDNGRLIRTLRHLADIGNTVLVVEHDEEMIRSADHLLDIGPGPGVHGGRVVAQGTVAEVAATVGSLTGDYLSHRRTIAPPEATARRKLTQKNAIVIKGARENNLKNVDAAFPLGGVVCVTGVSGSGKSTLVNDILLLGAKKELLGSKHRPGAHGKITGLNKIDRVIEVDQSPIGRTPRSNPATYTGIFDDIRKIFAQTKEAKIRGYQPGRFSFNVKAKSGGGGGRCEACEGQGLKKIEMHFLPDVYVTCEVCNGSRYNRETLEVKYRGKSIADVLKMTVEASCEFFENHPKIHRFVTCLRDVGLSYIELGQPSTTLSGGEAQRVKLATELGKGPAAGGGSGQLGAGGALYILDEPTTGLHFEDVRRLIEVLARLADAGNSLVVIEHNLDVIKCADWLIDLGPEGGDAGGTIIAEGTPEAVAQVEASHTGRYLREILAVK